MADNRVQPFSLSQDWSIILGGKRGLLASSSTNNGEIYSENLRENVTKKSRGRPKGSKNRAKEAVPLIIKGKAETVMESIILEIPAGRDVVEPLMELAISREARIIVLSGSGLISEVNFLHPVNRASSFPVEGAFRITSFSGTFAAPNTDPITTAESPNSHFSIFVSGNQGKVFGGVVGGRVVAAGAVFVTAALVKNPRFDRLGIIDADLNEHHSNNSTSHFN